MSTEDKNQKTQVENPTTNNEQETTQESTQETEKQVILEDQLKEEIEKEKDKFLRMFAEFENYKRRTAKERLELLATASEGVMIDLLPVLDDFDRAIAQMETLGASDHLTGFQLIATKLRDTLSTKGLALVDVNAGDSFDADVAEAITQIPAGDDMKGKIVDVVEKGYKLGEKIIRYPKVVIGQ
ncbi:MAG TPA: nucleotide exchange factor GrpE [Flavobacterium sp.]|nr:nucleotide exchange factor GrpE [Flavobacterium sp.]